MRRRGIGLATSIVIVLIVYFLCTAMVSQMRYSLNLAGQDAVDLDQYYRARGLVHEGLARLNNGEVALEDLQGNPWAEDDPSFPDALTHIRARVGEQTYSVVVRKLPEGELTMFYILPGPPDPRIAFFDGNSWNDVPVPPKFHYVGGALQDGHPGFHQATHIIGGHADHEGNLYLLYQPGGDGPSVVLSFIDQEWRVTASGDAAQTYVGTAAELDHGSLLRSDGRVDLLLPEGPEGVDMVTLDPPPGAISGQVRRVGDTTYYLTGSEIYALDGGTFVDDEFQYEWVLQSPAADFDPTFTEGGGPPLKVTSMRAGIAPEEGVLTYGIVDDPLGGSQKLVQWKGSWQVLADFSQESYSYDQNGKPQRSSESSGGYEIASIEVDGLGNPVVRMEGAGQSVIWSASVGLVPAPRGEDGAPITGGLRDLAQGRKDPSPGEPTYIPSAHY